MDRFTISSYLAVIVQCQGAMSTAPAVSHIWQGIKCHKETHKNAIFSFILEKLICFRNQNHANVGQGDIYS